MAKKPKKPEKPEEAEDPNEPKQADAPDAGEPTSKGSKKLLALAGVAVLVCLAAGGGYLFLRNKPDGLEVHKPKPTAFVDVREMTINLGAEPHQEQRRVLKFKAALEVHDPKTAAEIQPALPRVEDALQGFLREMRASDLEGSGGMHFVREELLRRVNLAIHPAKVDAVLLRDMLVQ